MIFRLGLSRSGGALIVNYGGHIHVLKTELEMPMNGHFIHYRKNGPKSKFRTMSRGSQLTRTPR